VGEQVAAGGTVDPGAVTPVAAGVVQRRYLDREVEEGCANWVADTTGHKAGSVASRGKLNAVDRLLQEALEKKSEAGWHEALRALDTRLQTTKYDQERGSKTSPTFATREAAVQRLRREIWAALPSTTPMAAALQTVGFTRKYLEDLPWADLHRLHAAHQALGAGHMVQAQRYLDALNPLEAYAVNDVKPTMPGWKDEDYKSIKIGESAPMPDFLRQRQEMMAAQRQLLAFHAPTIGGDYGRLLSYKPYKAQPLKPFHRSAATKYFTATELRDWDSSVLLGSMPKPGTSLQDAQNRAAEVAATYTQASAGRSAAKGRQPKPEPKAPLTPDEVTALRIYTADEYREMNAVFRDFRVDRPTANWAKYSALARLAISGLGKLPKARDTISYRGDNDVKFGGHSGVLKLGATFRLPNFYSTTARPAAAFPGDLGSVFHNKKSGRWIQPFSALSDEAEVLIPPGTPFKIVNEFHKQPDKSWVSADGLPLSSAPAVAHFKSKDKQRTVYLEFEEIV
jgi:hypothetical protein